MTHERPNPASRKLLVYEPRVEGHHPGWLRFITEDLLSGGFDLTLALDLRKQSRSIIDEHLGDLISRVALIPAVAENGRPRNGSTAAAIAAGLKASGASRAFLCAFDELASKAFRRAAFGLAPPSALQGRIGGIYHRPRFTAAPWWSPNRWLKAIGFRRFMQHHWAGPLLFVDEYLARDVKTAFPENPIFFLPDPCPDDFSGNPRHARTALGLPEDKTILLFFGVGARRKGLHLAVDAMLRLDRQDTFLLVAGRQDPSGRVRRGLAQLQRSERALILDRYVSSEEEKLCFQACDIVLLPYLNHFGTSGILSRAMATGKPVVASDEQLLGRLVRDHALGWRFTSGDASALTDCLARAVQCDPAEKQRLTDNAARYARRYSREGYRQALLQALAGPSIT